MNARKLIFGSLIDNEFVGGCEKPTIAVRKTA
jgi:hypothetical protein